MHTLSKLPTMAPSMKTVMSKNTSMGIILRVGEWILGTRNSVLSTQSYSRSTHHLLQDDLNNLLGRAARGIHGPGGAFAIEGLSYSQQSLNLGKPADRQIGATLFRLWIQFQTASDGRGVGSEPYTNAGLAQALAIGFAQDYAPARGDDALFAQAN